MALRTVSGSVVINVFVPIKLQQNRAMRFCFGRTIRVVVSFSYKLFNLTL